MGSKKRPTISQLVKKMEKEAKEKAREVTKGRVEIKAASMISSAAMISDDMIQEASKVIRSMPVVTTYSLAKAMGIKLTSADRLLRVLSEKGVIVPVNRTHRNKIYVAKQRYEALMAQLSAGS